jgi:hypothetical protein
MCEHFRKIWDRTQRLSLRPLKFPYRQQVTFPRFEHFMKREPPRGRHAKCKCGHSDAWRCWSRVRALELYGCGRRDNGAQLIRDFELLEEEDR